MCESIIWLKNSVFCSDAGTGIEKDSFVSNYNLYWFDLTTDLTGIKEAHLNDAKHGTLRGTLTYEKPISSAIFFVVYIERHHRTDKEIGKYYWVIKQWKIDEDELSKIFRGIKRFNVVRYKWNSWCNPGWRSWYKILVTELMNTG